MAGCEKLDSLCDEPGCQFTRTQWESLQALSGLPDPPPDRSNKYVGNAPAEALGQKFYFDTRFSGNATLVDMLNRPTQYARAAKGQPVQISCATCHNPARAGADSTSEPGNVSVGAGWYDVNGQQTVNAAYYPLPYWNGRTDSLWAQAAAVTESPVSMAGNRLQIVWQINDLDQYATSYAAVFPNSNPLSGKSSAIAPLLDPVTFQCTRPTDGSCPAGCFSRTATVGAATGCWPRFPLRGRPGNTAGCQPGTSEPFGDAFDCMDAADQTAVTRMYVNFAKAIAAYEYKLVSRNSAFDQWIAQGPKGAAISDSAKRGARLFVGKASCVECHNTPLLSDVQFHNVGAPQVGPAVPTVADCPEKGVCDCVNGTNCLPWGGWDGLKKLQTADPSKKPYTTYRRDTIWSDDPTDTSRAFWLNLPLTDDLKGSWRTPSLRDVALTAPYMHDGSLRTLEEVVWFYNLGGASADIVGQRSVQIRPLLLTDGEMSDLVAFLQTLTGEPLPVSLVTSPPLP
jgi:cytochrome c peroxidase